jgi:ferredoxin-thioredoxin reductase catalytic chain
VDEIKSVKARAPELMDRLRREAEEGGYRLNPDAEMVLMLCEGLLTNLDRHGYMGCPCRLMDGDQEKDLDLVCPCNYRDPDLDDFGACYCALYVSEEIAAGKKKAESIPERRPSDAERELSRSKSAPLSAGTKVWRCQVCGYLCAREHPPGRCPVCKAQTERFEIFSTRDQRFKVWRCQVCGYLCARERPAERCPVCKVGKERFEEFNFPG